MTPTPPPTVLAPRPRYLGTEIVRGLSRRVLSSTPPVPHARLLTRKPYPTLLSSVLLRLSETSDSVQVPVGLEEPPSPSYFLNLYGTCDGFWVVPPSTSPFLLPIPGLLGRVSPRPGRHTSGSRSLVLDIMGSRRSCRLRRKR